ncbi:MAG: dihydrofolate reductase family protein [Pseudomonadota bacterium]
MQRLLYSINLTLDGCYDHQCIEPDEELHRRATETLDRVDGLLFGRVIYQMMEDAWREPARTGIRPDWMPASLLPFARAMDAKKKYVVSSTLEHVDWNSELLRGDLAESVRRLKEMPGRGLMTGGVTLPMALAELGLIDDFEFVVHPRIVGHGPALFAGLTKPLDLKFVGRVEYDSGAVAMRYEAK